MFDPSATSISPFLHERIVFRPTKTRLPIRMPQTVVVDHDVFPEVNLVWMAQHDILSEDDVRSARSEKGRVQRFAQREADGSRTRLRKHDDQLVFDQRTRARLSDDELRIFLAARFPRIE